VKKPQDRPQGFAPVVAAIERLIEELEAPTAILAAPPIAVPPPRPKWMLPAILVMVAALASGLYLAMKPKSFPMAISTPTGEMVLVPAGDFLFGKDKTKVSLPAFYIDKTEVPNAAYAQFCKESGHTLPEGFAADKPDYPVVNVTILDALAYAKWAGKRLPNSREWEKAARGVDGRTYPWGEAANSALANVGGGVVGPISTKPGGVSPFGALNMVGNVWELVEQESKPSPETVKSFAGKLQPDPGLNEPWYAMRGQSYAEPLLPEVLSDVGVVPARWKYIDLGFRCVQDLK